MRIAIAQLHSGADVEANVTAAERLVREAAEGGADVAALPEYLAFMGAASMRASVAETIPGPTTDRLGAVASDRGIWVLAGGLLESAGGRIHDTAALIDRDGQVVATYRKIHLFDADLPGQPPMRESETITPGDRVV